MKTVLNLSLLALGIAAAVVFARPIHATTPAKTNVADIWERPAGEKIAVPSAWQPSDSAEPIVIAADRGHRMIRWHSNYAQAKAQADAEKKPLFVEVTMKNCIPCKALDEAMTDPAVSELLDKFVAVKIDSDSPDAARYAVANFPETVVYGADTKLRAFQTGALDAAALKAHLDTAFSPATTAVVSSSAAAGATCSTCGVCSPGQCATGSCCSACNGACGQASRGGCSSGSCGSGRVRGFIGRLFHR